MGCFLFFVWGDLNGLVVNDSPVGCQSQPWPSPQARANPFFSAKKERSKKLRSFFYPSRRLGISSPREAWCISSALRAVSHHAPACISCGLMIYNASHWWYTATSCGWYTRLRRDWDARLRKFLNCFAKYDIILSKSVIVWLKTTSIQTALMKQPKKISKSLRSYLTNVDCEL